MYIDRLLNVFMPYILFQILFIIDEAIRMFDRYVPFAGLTFSMYSYASPMDSCWWYYGK